MPQLSPAAGSVIFIITLFIVLIFIISMSNTLSISVKHKQYTKKTMNNKLIY